MAARTKKARLVRVLTVLASLAVVLTAWHFARPRLRKPLAGPDAATLDHLAHVKILRDTYGVPHVFGHTDADAAFGLAYAHAEDDFPTIQAVVAASRGLLGYVLFDKKALAIDYYANLVRAVEKGQSHYEQLSPQTKKMVEGYAAGLNYYAYKHPSEVDARLYPITGAHVVAGFVHKLSIMVGVTNALEALGKGAPRHAGDAVTLAWSDDPRLSPREFPGSNAHAVHRTRSADDITRLNVNSHQPWEGPVAWYEAQIVSDEGWNMTGGTFPGGPILLHGHNEKLGWALTVNYPDLLDVFELTTDKAHPGQYLFEGEWKAFETKPAPLTFDTGLVDVTVSKDVQWSVHGPALELNGVMYAFRYAGMDRGGHAVEQWFRLNKATSHDEWRAAMEVAAIPMFHTVYADRDHIEYLYNALLPIRKPGFDYSRVLPGDKRDAIFESYLPPAALPHVLDPPSGFVQGCNSTPFSATDGEGNPSPDAFSPLFGIERNETNRARRSLTLLGGTAPIDRAHWEIMKWDTAYDRASDMFTQVIGPVLALPIQSDDQKKTVELLHDWDGRTSADSKAATLAILMYKSLRADSRDPSDPVLVDPRAALDDAMAFLKKSYGRVDVPLGEVQRLHRGQVDLPLGGGPEVLNAIYTKRENGKLVGVQGDSYVLEVEFGADKTTSRAIHQYGASNRPASPHYADQAPLFAERKLRPSWRTREEIRAHLEREYTPGE